MRTYESRVLVVIHGFNLENELALRVPLPGNNWQTSGTLLEAGASMKVLSGELLFTLPAGCHAGVWLGHA